MIKDGTDRLEAAARFVDDLRAAPWRRDELVGMLQEQAPVFQGLGTRDAERLRGYVLASFETLGLPQEALPFVLEELETGFDPYPVAAAAKALRGASEIPDVAIRLLGEALRRIAANDDYVCYDTLAPGRASASRTTALDELVRTVSKLGPRAEMLEDALKSIEISRHGFGSTPLVDVPHDRTPTASKPSETAASGCCCASSTKQPRSPAVSAETIGDLLLEDQGGKTFTFDAFFAGRPSVVTFFYTRCMNPEKCSLTIRKLARLQRLIREAGLHDGVNIAAFTYDPSYDRADRLHAYGTDRGMRFDGRNKLLRTLGPFEPVRALFDLNVGFGPATVNRHSVEVLILDEMGRLSQYFARTQWLETDIEQIIRSMSK